MQSDQFNFTSGLAGAQTAIDQMRDRTDGMCLSLYLATLWFLICSVCNS